MEFPEIRIFQISGFMGLYGYPIAGYGTVCMSDGSSKAWSMLFESEAWPLPFRVKENIDTCHASVVALSIHDISFCGSAFDT